MFFTHGVDRGASGENAGILRCAQNDDSFFIYCNDEEKFLWKTWRTRSYQ